MLEGSWRLRGEFKGRYSGKCRRHESASKSLARERAIPVWDRDPTLRTRLHADALVARVRVGYRDRAVQKLRYRCRNARTTTHLPRVACSLPHSRNTSTCSKHSPHVHTTGPAAALRTSAIGGVYKKQLSSVIGGVYENENPSSGASDS